MGKPKEEQLKVGPWGGAASGAMQVKEQPIVGPEGERVATSESNSRMNTNKTDDEILRRSRSPFVKIRAIGG